jgi:hypothetical protein
MFFSILSCLPVAVLMFKGRELREKFGTPRNVNAPYADFEGPVEVDKLREEKRGKSRRFRPKGSEPSLRFRLACKRHGGQDKFSRMSLDNCESYHRFWDTCDERL